MLENRFITPENANTIMKIVPVLLLWWKHVEIAHSNNETTFKILFLMLFFKSSVLQVKIVN